MFQARIHPEVPAKALGPQRSAALLAALTGVCRAAVAADADSAQLPPDWLFHRRWGKKPGKTACGAALAFLTVGGRTSCFAPALQRKTEGGASEGVDEESEQKAPPKKAPKKRAAATEAAEDAAPAAAAPKRGKKPAPPPQAAAAAMPRAAGRRAAAASAAVQLAAAAAGRLRLP